uniref:Uncharacterized protein n=1 Tax=Spongospora subterranea TaxID=70186 RepID=A0A0H5RDJ7_9EUKA|eukprot:CRZ12295.1 hypothetical protein [Spongospora subterranea]
MGFLIRRSSNREQADVPSAKPVIYRFHRELLSLFCQEPHIDRGFGHYAKRDVFNFDQSRFRLSAMQTSALSTRFAKRVWLRPREPPSHNPLDAVQPKPRM